MAGRIHVGDVGTKFRVRMLDETGQPISLAAATTRQLIFRRPNRQTFTVPATVEAHEDDTGPVQSLLTYVTVSGNINIRGQWSVRGHVVLPTGEWRSTEEQFNVFE